MPTESRKKPKAKAAAEAALEAAITATVDRSSSLGAAPITMEAILAMGFEPMGEELDADGDELRGVGTSSSTSLLKSVLGDDGDALAQELDAAVDEDNATRGAVRTAAVIAGKRKEADLSDDESELEDNNDESASEEDDSDDEEDADAASGHGKGAKGRGKKSSSRAKRSVHFEEFARSASARKGAAKKKKEKAAATTSATRKGGVQRAPSSLFAPSASEVALAVARIGTRGRSSSNQQGATGAQSRRRKKGPKRKTGKTAGCLLPEDIGTMLGQAHRFFLEGRYADALPLLSEVVRLAPGHPDAYTTLGMTFEAQANDVSLAARHHRRHRQHDATAATSTTATTAIASAATTAYQGITSATATNAATMTTAVSRASAAGFRAQALQMFVVAAELDRKNKEAWRHVAELSSRMIERGDYTGPGGVEVNVGAGSTAAAVTGGGALTGAAAAASAGGATTASSELDSSELINVASDAASSAGLVLGIVDLRATAERAWRRLSVLDPSNLEVAGEHAAVLAQQGNHRLATATYERILRLAQEQQSEVQQKGNEEDEEEEEEHQGLESTSTKSHQVNFVCLDHWFGYAASSWAMVDARAALDVVPNWSFDDRHRSSSAAASEGERGGVAAAAVGSLSCGGDVGSYTSVMTYQEKASRLAAAEKSLETIVRHCLGIAPPPINSDEREDEGFDSTNMDQNALDRQEGSFQATSVGDEGAMDSAASLPSKSIERDAWTLLSAEECPESPLLAALATHGNTGNAAASTGMRRTLQLTMHGETVSSPLVALQLGMRACSLLLSRVYMHESRQAMRRCLQLYAVLTKRLQGLNSVRKVLVRGSSEITPEHDSRGKASSSSGTRMEARNGKKASQCDRTSQGRVHEHSSNQTTTKDGSSEMSLVRMGDSGARESVAELEESMIGFASEESSDTASDDGESGCEDNDKMAEDGEGLLEVEGGIGRSGVGTGKRMRMDGSNDEFSGDDDSDEGEIFGQGAARGSGSRRHSFLATGSEAEWTEVLKLPSDVVASVGCCHAGLGNFTAAKACLAPLLQQDPSNPIVSAALARVSDTFVELAALAPARYPLATTTSAATANEEAAAAAAKAVAQTTRAASSLSQGEAQSSSSSSEVLAAVATSLAMRTNPNALELVVLAAMVWRRKLRVPDAPRPITTSATGTTSSNSTVTNPIRAEAPSMASLTDGSSSASGGAGGSLAGATAGPAEWTRMAELLVASRKPAQALLWLKRALAFAPTHAPAVLMLAQVARRRLDHATWASDVTTLHGSVAAAALAGTPSAVPFPGRGGATYSGTVSRNFNRVNKSSSGGGSSTGGQIEEEAQSSSLGTRSTNENKKSISTEAIYALNTLLDAYALRDKDLLVMTAGSADTAIVAGSGNSGDANSGSSAAVEAPTTISGSSGNRRFGLVWAAEHKQETLRSGPAIHFRFLIEWALLRCQVGSTNVSSMIDDGGGGSRSDSDRSKTKRARLSDTATKETSAIARDSAVQTEASLSSPDTALSRALDVLSVAVPFAEAIRALLVPAQSQQNGGENASQSSSTNTASNLDNDDDDDDDDDQEEASSVRGARKHGRTLGGRLASSVGAALSNWVPAPLAPFPSPAAALWSPLLLPSQNQEEEEQQQFDQQQLQQQRRRAAAAKAMAKHSGTLIQATGGFVGLVHALGDADWWPDPASLAPAARNAAAIGADLDAAVAVRALDASLEDGRTSASAAGTTSSSSSSTSLTRLEVDIGAGSGEDLATLFSAAAAALAVVLNHGPPENTGQYTSDATAKQSDSATFTATNGDENDSKTDADAAGTTAVAVAIWRESVLRAGEALLEVIEHFVSNTESCRVRLRIVTATALQLRATYATLLDEKLRDVADTAIHDNVAAESVDGSAGVSASRSAPAGASNDNVSANSMDTSPTSTVTAVPLDPTLVVTARTAHAGDFYEATVVKGASGLLLGVGPVAASSSSSFTGGDNDKEEGEEVATGLCITRFREPPVEQDNSGVHASADSTAAVLPFRHPLEEQGVLLGDIIAAFSRKRHASETSPTSDEEGGEEDDEEEGGKEKWLHVEQWPYEDVRAKLLSMPLGQQSVLFRRSQFASVPGENGSGIAATGMEAPPPPMTLASAQRDAAAAGTAMSQLLQLTRLPPLPSGVAGRWVDDHNPLHKHRAATRASNAVATVRAGTLSTGSGGSGSGGAGGSGLEQGFVAKRREGAFRAVGATDDTPGTSSDLVPMHTSGPSTRADSAMPASGNAGAGSAAAATPTAAATAAVDLIETKGRRARPGFTSCSGTSIASAATIKSHARALDLAQGIGGDNDSAAIAGAFSAVVAFPESRDVANAFVTTLQSAVEEAMRECASSTAPLAASSANFNSHGHLVKHSVTALRGAASSSIINKESDEKDDEGSTSSSSSGSSHSSSSTSRSQHIPGGSNSSDPKDSAATTDETTTHDELPTTVAESLPTRSLLSTSLQQRVDLPRLLRRLNGRHPAAVLPPLLIGHTQVAQNLYPTALQNYLVALRNAKLLHVRNQRRRMGLSSQSSGGSGSLDSAVVEFPEPLLPLCAGTVVLRASMNRRIQDRHSVIVAALALLSEYTRARCGYLLPPPQTPVPPLKVENRKKKRKASFYQEEEAAEEKKEIEAQSVSKGKSIEEQEEEGGGSKIDGQEGDGSESVQVQCARALLEQEATYNLGRAMHQLDLGFLAVQWYEKVLALEDHLVRPLIKELRRAEKTKKKKQEADRYACANDKGGETSAQAIASRSSLLVHRDATAAMIGGGGATVALPELTAEMAVASSVAPEAAHNLSLVYKASGNTDLAATMAQRYMPVI